MNNVKRIKPQQTIFQDKFKLALLEVLDIEKRNDWILRLAFHGPGPKKEGFVRIGEFDFSFGKIAPRDFCLSLRVLADEIEKYWRSFDEGAVLI